MRAQEKMQVQILRTVVVMVNEGDDVHIIFGLYSQFSTLEPSVISMANKQTVKALPFTLC